MCGIAGLTFRHPTRLDPSLVDSTLRQLAHRGPDDQGWLTLGPEGVHRGRAVAHHGVVDVALLHRRLSIIDLTAAGWQPMSTADDRYHIVHNGEIYNYLELRGELARRGIKFRSSSDTEVLLAAYAVWGAAVLPRLIGMFAFAILDVAERRLFLARDFFGIKPLYYARWQHGFAFASEIKMLLAIPGVHRDVNPEALYDYLRFGLTDHGPNTLFSAVRQVPPGHYVDLALGAGAVEPRRYWGLAERDRSTVTFPDAAAGVRERFLDNVRLHLRSDVPVGVALSGGIDSSAIVMAVRHLEPGLDIQTFSYVADDDVVSEERWADITAGAAATRPHKVRLRPGELIADLDDLISVQGEPFGSTSIYAQYCVFRAAREAGITVMLDGQGADELFAGYLHYREARLASLLRQGQWVEAARFLRHGRRPQHQNVIRFLGKAGMLSLPDPLARLGRRVATGGAVPGWLNARWFRDRDVAIDPPARGRGREVLRAELLASVNGTLPALLRYEDRNSMAYSLESRVPFLTTALAEFALSLPEAYLMAGDGTSKAVLRAAMRGLVPDSILDRRDKIGFATPELRWLVGAASWVSAVLGADTISQVGGLDPARVLREWNGVRQQHRPFSFRVWRWINVLRWSEINGVRFA